MINHEDSIKYEENLTPTVQDAVVITFSREAFGWNHSDWWKGIEVVSGRGRRVAMLELDGSEYGPESVHVAWDTIRDGKLVFWKAKLLGVRTAMYHLFLGDLRARTTTDLPNRPLVTTYDFIWSIDCPYSSPHPQWPDYFPGTIRQGYWGDRPCRFVARHSGKVLDVETASQKDGAAVIQYQANGGDNQRWRPEVCDHIGRHRLVAVHSGKALDVEGVSEANGARLTQWGWWGGTNQTWDLVAVDTGYYKIVAAHSGKCLDVLGGSQDDWAPVVQWDYHGGHNQQFAVERL